MPSVTLKNMVAYNNIAQLDYSECVRESVHVISTASLFWVDYDAVFRDFPFLRDTESVDEFMLANAALVTAPHVLENRVNTPISIVPDKTLLAYRPPRYGRALVRPFEITSSDGSSHSGLLDLKGTGIASSLEPKMGYHESGLMKMREAVQGVVHQKMIERIMEKENHEVSGVPIYCIIDSGFKFDDHLSSNNNASILVRQAHRRETNGNELPLLGSTEMEVQSKIESVLREYGVTSTGLRTTFEIRRNANGEYACQYGKQLYPHITNKHLCEFVELNDLEIPVNGKLTVECTNVQITRDVSANPLKASVIDFSAYDVQNSFSTPVMTLVDDTPLNWGRPIYKNDPHYANVNPDKLLNWELCRSKPICDEHAKRYNIPADTEVSGIDEFCLELSFAKSDRSTMGQDIDHFVESLFQ